jgi:regulator of sigma E protease
MTILATVIVLGVLIFVHELGHFAAAKAVGIEVQRFSIGLGPKVVGYTYGETEYVFSAIPLGGYVKMGGMDDEVMERLEGGATPREPGARDFDSKPIWARTLVISAGVIMNMIFAFGLYVFVFANWGLPELSTTRLGIVQVETLPPGTEGLARIAPGSRFVRIGSAEIESWGDVQRGLLNSPPGPIQIELVEPQYVVEIRIPADEMERRALTGSVGSWIEAGVGALIPGGPAAKAGLEIGDRITAVNGDAVENWYDFVSEIQSRPGQRVELSVVREGREIVRALTVDAEEVEQADGTTATTGRVGIQQPGGDITYSSVPVSAAFGYGYRETVAVAGMILGFLGDLVTGGVSPRSLGSIVTIGEFSGRAAALGLDYYLRFMAMFSINLAVLNLMPIPVLDGGHLVFLAIETVRGGRGLTLEQKLKWSNFGFLIVVGIMLLALSNDVLRLLGL